MEVIDFALADLPFYPVCTLSSFDNVRKMLHLLIQLAAIINFGYTIYWDLYILKLPGRPSFGGQWKYLTFINLWIQLIYFSVSFFNNFIGSQATESAKASKLQRCRDLLFATLAFPIGQFVGIVFWVLFYVDRELVFPAHYDNFFPNYINHAMHTTVIPAQLLELFNLYHAYPKRLNGMSITMIFCFVYLTWTLIVAHFGGIWVIIFLRLVKNCHFCLYYFDRLQFHKKNSLIFNIKRVFLNFAGIPHI